jgi:hypothetical protein
MSGERGSDTEPRRWRTVLAGLPRFLLKDLWRSDDLPAPPEPDRPPAAAGLSWLRWLFESEQLPDPPPEAPQPVQTSFLRWLSSREELPGPSDKEDSGNARSGVGPDADATLLNWLVAGEPLPEREPRPRVARETGTLRELATIATPVLVLGAIVALTFVADEPVRHGRVGLGLLYVAAMLVVSFAGAVATARWLYAPEIGRKLAWFYIGFGFLWLNLHLLLIHSKSSDGGGALGLYAHLAIGNAIAALATAVLNWFTRRSRN